MKIGIWQKIKCKLGLHTWDGSLPCGVCYYCEAFNYKEYYER